jgi:hypothetical protein
MGLLDLRIASTALDLEGRVAPSWLDLRTTREIGRLAIVPSPRGGLQVVMVGLLREMLAWCEANGIRRLLAGSTERLYGVYARYNPTARRLYAPRVADEDPAITAWFAAKRAYGRGRTVLYTFEVAGASPWSVFSRFLTLRLKPRGTA